MRDKILDYFELLKRNNSVGPAYLFIGDDYHVVNDIFKLINCREHSRFCEVCWDCSRIAGGKHPDVFVIEPEPVTIKIERIREAHSFLSLKSFRLKKKIIFIKEAQSFSEPAANAFLKSLEEPPKNTFIAVCSRTVEGLLPTIISRCRKIFLPFNEKLEAAEADVLRGFLEGRINKFGDRRKLRVFLLTFISALRDHIVALTGGNALSNRLLNNRGYEIIFRRYSAEKALELLGEAIKIYGMADTINENLALNLLRVKL